MLTYLRRLLFDEGAFLGAIRAVLMALGYAVESGRIPWPDDWQWLGIIAMGGAMLMRSTVPVHASTATTTPTPRGETKI